MNWASAIGNATNNEAEYRALVRGLERAKHYGSEIEIRTDSELLARQLKGLYKVRADNLKPLYAEAQRALKHFKPLDDCDHPAHAKSPRGQIGKRSLG